MATVTLNPGTGNGTVGIFADGTTFGAGVQNTAVWNAMRGGTGTKSVAGDGSGLKRVAYADTGSNFNDPNYYLYRSFYPFDFSAIPAGSITAVKFRLYIEASSLNSTLGGSLYVVQSTQASLTSITTADLTAVGSTSFCDTHPTFAGITTSAYYEFTLNAAGIGAVSVGNAKLAVLHSYDFTATAPPRQIFTSLYDDMFTRLTGAASNKPELVVTYTPSSGGLVSRPNRTRGLYPR